jgi:hypothetical protein
MGLVSAAFVPNWPGMHSLQSLVGCGENLPAGQALHTAQPTRVYSPREHTAQNFRPDPSWYFPAVVNGECAVMVNGQWSVVHRAPGGQEVHEWAFENGRAREANLPIGQEEHSIFTSIN